MIESVKISSVMDLYVQYATYARYYSLVDNPLTGLTKFVPASASYYTVVPYNDTEMAEAIMKKLAGRRKLRSVEVLKDDIKHPAFLPTNRLVIFYV